MPCCCAGEMGSDWPLSVRDGDGGGDKRVRADMSWQPAKSGGACCMVGGW